MFRRKAPEDKAKVSTIRDTPPVGGHFKGDFVGLPRSGPPPPTSPGVSGNCFNGFEVVDKDPEKLPYPLHKEEELRDMLYYLASLVPRRDSWEPRFVDSPHRKGDYTRAVDARITIRATLTKDTESYILLPFGDKPAWCRFPPTIEFAFSSSVGDGVVEACHVCDLGVHRLVFPDDVVVGGEEHSLRDILPLTLTH